VNTVKLRNTHEKNTKRITNLANYTGDISRNL